MISIDFLNYKVDGMEFMEFQDTQFYNKFSGFLKDYISEEAVLSDECIKGMKAIIKEFTGFENISVKITDEGNLAVDTGFFSPNHILNNEDIDQYLKHTQTTLYRWFSQNKERIFKGGVDYRTGKVTGGFKNIPVKLYINKNLKVTFPDAKVAKYKVPLHGILAGCITHELGHIFGGCMMMATAASDNVLAKAGLSYYKQALTKEDRVVVLQDTANLMEVKASELAELQAIAESDNEGAFVLYYNKLITKRNEQRSLSMGVAAMSSEVIADMYAIRMGCGESIIAAIGIMVDTGAVETFFNTMMLSIVSTLLISAITLPSIMSLVMVFGFGVGVGIVGTIFALSAITVYFSGSYSGTYNADNRRFDDALRQLIAKFKEEKDIPSEDRQTALAKLQEYVDINNKLKPWYENTIIRRMLGRVFQGSDFTKVEVEHYTSVLSNHEINLLGDQLKLAK